LFLPIFSEKHRKAHELRPDSKPAEKAAEHGKQTPMERPVPEEVAPAFVFFASEADSSYITRRF
jgi:NAD(P)-dependent dehydrogenase (short-subunit alcohol dehydrogenase family)